MEMNLTPDQALRVMFYEKGVHQPYQSTEEKRPIFKTVTYVRIVSGGGLSEIDRPMYVGEGVGMARERYSDRPFCLKRKFE